MLTSQPDILQPWILTHKDNQGKEILFKASCASCKSYMLCKGPVRKVYGRIIQIQGRRTPRTQVENNFGVRLLILYYNQLSITNS